MFRCAQSVCFRFPGSWAAHARTNKLPLNVPCTRVSPPWTAPLTTASGGTQDFTGSRLREGGQRTDQLVGLTRSNCWRCTLKSCYSSFKIEIRVRSSTIRVQYHNINIDKCWLFILQYFLSPLTMKRCSYLLLPKRAHRKKPIWPSSATNLKGLKGFDDMTVRVCL